MNNLKETLDSLASSSTSIHMSSETGAKLQEQGLLRVVPRKSLDELFFERKQHASDTIRFFPELPKNLPPAIQSLYQQIMECILFGLNGAAITLSGNLIEFALKHFTYLKEIGGYGNYKTDEWDKFEEIELGDSIRRAKKAGLLTSEMAKNLESFRKDIRNPYSHYNIRKITINVIAHKVKCVNLETGTVTEQDMEAKDHPWLQAQAKPWVDKERVLNVFHFADNVLKYLMSKFENVEKSKTEETT